MELRPYQREAVERCMREWQERQSTLLLMATGLGKTVVFASIVRRFMRERACRAMVVAHREELVEQAAVKVAKVADCDVAIEMADRRALEGGFAESPVICASVQTLTASGGRRLKRFDPSRFGLVVFDEAHHAAARSWRAVWDHFRPAGVKLLGATATPDRGDEKALGQVFESVAFDCGILDGVLDGWLVPVRQQVVHVHGLDLSGVHTTAGDLNAGELDDVLRYEKTLHRMAGSTIEIAGDRRTLVFAASVEHAKRIAEIFNRWKAGSAAVVSAKTDSDERRAIFRDYGAGRIQYLCNVGIATEGWDDPATDGRGVQVIAMMRPTKSRSLYAQMAGRGTRPLPGIVDGVDHADERKRRIALSGKPGVLLLDFRGNAGRHRLVHAGDVLGGKWDDETREAAAERAAASGGEVDVLAMLDRAEVELREKRERERRRFIRAKARFTTEEVDPFAFVGVPPPKVSGWRAKLPVTPKQRAVLEREGIPHIERLCCDEASAIIDQIFKRPSKAQAWVLRKHGLDPADFDRRTASAAIDRIKRGEVVTG